VEVFGDRETFAIAFAPRRALVPRLREAHVCYWIGGRQVGNWDAEFTYLGDLKADLGPIVKDNGRREAAELWDLPPGALMKTVFWRLIDDHQAGAPGAIDMPARFIILPGVSAFTGWHALAITRGPEARIVFKHEDWDEAGDVVVEDIALEGALLSCWQRLEVLTTQI
jgi:hypothetical protein